MLPLLETTQHFNRPPFDAAGRIVARREVKVGRVYHAGETIDHAGELDARRIELLWNQGLIDTIPRGETFKVTPGELVNVEPPKKRDRRPSP